TNFCRVCNATFATPNILSVNAGRNRCLSRSISDTSEERTPAGEPRLTGNQPSQTENNMRSNSPIQKAGVEASVKQYPLIRRSIHVPSFIPEMTPSKNPITPEMSQAIPINANEARKRSPMTLATSLRYKREVPKSPCKTFFPQLINCWTFGSFNPQYSAIFSRCSGLTLVISAPIYDWTGSIGDRLRSVKDRMLTAISSVTNLIAFPNTYKIIFFRRILSLLLSFFCYYFFKVYSKSNYLILEAWACTRAAYACTRAGRRPTRAATPLTRAAPPLYSRVANVVFDSEYTSPPSFFPLPLLNEVCNRPAMTVWLYLLFADFQVFIH